MVRCRLNLFCHLIISSCPFFSSRSSVGLHAAPTRARPAWVLLAYRPCPVWPARIHSCMLFASLILEQPFAVAKPCCHSLLHLPHLLMLTTNAAVSKHSLVQSKKLLKHSPYACCDILDIHVLCFLQQADIPSKFELGFSASSLTNRAGPHAYLQSDRSDLARKAIYRAALRLLSRAIPFSTLLSTTVSTAV